MDTGINSNEEINIKKSINDFNNRQKPSEITEEFINESSDADIELALMDFIWDIKLTDYDREYEIVTSLPDGLVMMYSTWILEAEVNNGGFNQYFYNSSNQFVDEAYEGLKTIGAVKHAELLKKAVDVFMSEVDMQKEMREKGTIEAFSDSYKETKLNELDKLFYNLDEDLSNIRVKYIRNNIQKFICQ